MNEYEKFKKRFAVRMKKVLKDKPKAKIARDLGISEATIYSWVNGLRTPHLMQFVALCEYLKIMPNTLLGVKK